MMSLRARGLTWNRVTERERKRERKRKRKKEEQKKRERDRQRQTETDRETERDRQSRSEANLMVHPSIHPIFHGFIKFHYFLPRVSVLCLPLQNVYNPLYTIQYPSYCLVLIVLNL